MNCVLIDQEMLKYTDVEDSCELQEALETMLSVVKHVNDIMHQISIKGFEVRLTHLINLATGDE